MKKTNGPASERLFSIARWLDDEGRIDVADVAGRLGVAQETIRRDLRSLETAGRLQRVHGGAVPVSADPVAPVSIATEPAGRDEATMAARLWRQLPRTGTLLLGAGRLTLSLASEILTRPPEQAGLTIVTSSLDAAIVLSRIRTLSVYNIGGTVSSDTRAQEGDWALHELGRLHTDISIVCPSGIHPVTGLSQSTPAAAAVSAAEVAAGSRVIVLTDPETLGCSAFVRFAGLDRIEQIALAGQVPPTTLQPFVDRDVSISVDVHLDDGSSPDRGGHLDGHKEAGT